MLGYLSVDIICFKKQTVFQERNCELRRTDNIQGQISEHIFAPDGGYCVVPENIHTPTTEGIGNSEGEGGCMIDLLSRGPVIHTDLSVDLAVQKSFLTYYVDLSREK